MLISEIVETPSMAQTQKSIPGAGLTLLLNQSAQALNETQIQFIDDGRTRDRGGNGEVARAILHAVDNCVHLTCGPGVCAANSCQDVAVKILFLSRDVCADKLEKKFNREVYVWSQLRHENVLKMLGHYFRKDHRLFCLVGPWVCGGNVISYLKAHKPMFSVKLGFASDAAKGLHYLHTCIPPICHGDIKASNVLINNGQAQLCDFGLSYVVGEEGTPLFATGSDFKGSIPWSSPELLLGAPRNLKSDEWAYGWLVWEIVTGKRPFHDSAVPAAIVYRIMAFQLPDVSDFPQPTPMLMQGCWKKEPDERLTMSHVVKIIQKATDSAPRVQSRTTSEVSTTTSDFRIVVNMPPPSPTMKFPLPESLEDSVAIDVPFAAGMPNRHPAPARRSGRSFWKRITSALGCCFCLPCCPESPDETYDAIGDSEAAAAAPPPPPPSDQPDRQRVRRAWYTRALRPFKRQFPPTPDDQHTTVAATTAGCWGIVSGPMQNEMFEKDSSNSTYSLASVASDPLELHDIINVASIPGFPSLFRGTRGATMKMVAIKVPQDLKRAIEMTRTGDAPEGRTEAEIETAFRQHVTQAHSLGSRHTNSTDGHTVIESHLGVVNPWCENGNVRDYMQRNPQVDLWNILDQVFQGLMLLHGQHPPAVHGCLKPENVLIDAEGRVLLSEVGELPFLETVVRGITTCGPTDDIRWAPPEVLLGAERSAESDVYMVGLLGQSILNGRVPFSEFETPAAIVAAISSGERPFDDCARHAWGPVCDLLGRCRDVDPAQRPTIFTAHSQFAGYRAAAGHLSPIMDPHDIASLSDYERDVMPRAIQTEETEDVCVSQLPEPSTLYFHQVSPASLLSSMDGITPLPSIPNTFPERSGTPVVEGLSLAPENLRLFGRQDTENVIDRVCYTSARRDKSHPTSTLPYLGILGPGGAGKTSVALAAVCDYCVGDVHGDFVTRVPYQQATSPEPLVELNAHGIGAPKDYANYVGPEASSLEICSIRGEEFSYKLEPNESDTQLLLDFLQVQAIADGPFERENRPWIPPNHPIVDPYLGSSNADGSSALVSQWHENGNAREYLTTHPQCNCKEIITQVARGLIYLHSHFNWPFEHGDLKSTNVVIDDTGAAQLADFGLSQLLEDVGKGFTPGNAGRGSIRYMSPELLRGGEPAMPSDVWDFGCLALEIMSGKLVSYDPTEVHRVALHHRPPGHPCRWTSLNDAANAILVWRARDGRPKDLSEAVASHMEALSLRLPDHPDRVCFLNDLAAAIFKRFQKDGESTDLSDAIELYKEALNFQRLDHPNRSDSLSNLAASIFSRYKDEGRRSDPSEATKLHWRASVLSSHYAPHRCDNLQQVASTNHHKSLETGTISDVTMAMSYQTGTFDTQPAESLQSSPIASLLTGYMYQTSELSGPGEKDASDISPGNPAIRASGSKSAKLTWALDWVERGPLLASVGQFRAQLPNARPFQTGCSYLPDLYSSSYTPTLQALRRARGPITASSDATLYPLVITGAQALGQADHLGIDKEAKFVGRWSLSGDGRPSQLDERHSRGSAAASIGGLSSIPRSFAAPNPPKARKALLVAISYSGKTSIINGHTVAVPELDSAHDDAKKWQKILMDNYGYRVEDIVCLSDTPENVGTPQWPSKNNIRSAMDDLVEGVRPNDRRFFFVAAHGVEQDYLKHSAGYINVSETDGKDESIWTSEGPDRLGLAKLTENAIHRGLVGNGQIVEGATLTAVAVTSRSGNILDLPYEMRKDGAQVQFSDAKRNPVPLKGNIICISGCERSTHFCEPGSNRHVGVLTECFVSLLDQTLTIPVDHLAATLSAWLKTAEPDQSSQPVVTCGNTKTLAGFSP